ncbi:phage tail tape measure protein [Pseudomonas monteilii]|uniref:phage tail tape measure protein n=1 Tax=Pseudomonas TaxID=286 RepID=UPI0018E67F65|nr:MULTISPECIES: phage tail tape measure protein [Pseudomonas]MBI6920295.1 phage tail tape measure protein [Pseudomonas monteilii]MCE0939664.1 phage tail tape measure protein [Pseudomonas kurunegalensis]
MASKSLGTLTLDLIAKIGGFTGPLDQASRESQKRMAEIKKSAENLGKGIGTAFAAVPAIVAGLVTSSAMAAKEITNLSSLAGLTTTEFQRYAAGAASVGVEQDKLSDIFKDTNDKIGDFLATGGGELKNFFETIAPKVGVTAEQFRNLNSADALQLYVTSLQKANVSQAQMTFFMEAIADEATALVPLLADGGKKFKEYGDSAQAAGMILDEQTIGAAQQFSTELTVISQYASSAKTALAAEFMPVLAQLAKDLAGTTKEAGGLRNVVGEFANDFIEVTAVTASLADGIGRAFKITAAVIVSGFASTMAHLQSIGATANTLLGAVTFGDMSKDFKENADRLTADAIVHARTSSSVMEEVAEAFNKPWSGDAIRAYVKEARKAAAELPKIVPPGRNGAGFVGQTDAEKAAQKAAEAAAKKLNQSFETAEENLKRQIALINTSTDARKNATEVAKLQFEIESGKLVGINSKQQERLNGLAVELDRLQQLKKANEDAAKAKAFADTLSQSNRNVREGFDLELAGAGAGDKLKERLKADLAIQQDYQNQLADLQKQYNGGDISEELYKQETELLREALEERMQIQQDYYTQQDDAQSNWLDGVSTAWQNYRDTAVDYQQQAADFTASTLGTLTSSVGDGIASMILESESLGDAFVNVASTMAKSIINALAQMAAQWLVYQAVQLVAGKTTQASAATTLIANAQATSFQAQLAAFASTAAIPIVGPFLAPAAAATAAGITAPMVAGVAASALAGMAHDGIDSIPEDGTWFLQKGERVTTAETSAKLDSTLSRIQANQGQHGQGQPVVNLYEDASRAGQSRRNEDGSIDIWVSQLMSDGAPAQALEAKYGLQAVGR